MSTKREVHYDGWGNPILPHFAMLTYFQYSPKSIKILQRWLPKDIVVIPKVEITFDPFNPREITVYKIYPNGSGSFTTVVSNRALEGLRTAYKGRGGWVGIKTPSGRIKLVHVGQVIKEPSGKYRFHA